MRNENNSPVAAQAVSVTGQSVRLNNSPEGSKKMIRNNSGKGSNRSNGSSNGGNGQNRFNQGPRRPQRPFRSPVREDIYLSVIVPAYNEEERLPKTLETIGDYLKKQPYTYEIIVANDGSKDETGRVVETLIGKVSKLKLLDNHVNHGKGYVVRQGLSAARGQIRLFTDSDNSTPIEEVEKLLPFFKQGYDVVIGSRDAEGAKLDPPQAPLRQFLGDGWSLLTKIVVGTWGISDTQCGFKALSAKAATEILPKCRIDRFAFDPEILILAKSYGYRIKEVGILWKNDTRSTVKFNSMVKMFKDLLMIRMNQIKGAYGKTR